MVGLVSGVIIAYTGIHPFVVTLATQSICRGAAYLIAVYIDMFKNRKDSLRKA